MLRQSPFQGHIIAALDTAVVILVSAEQTGISSARINHFTEEERGGGGAFASWFMFVVVSSDKAGSQTRRAAWDTEPTRGRGRRWSVGLCQTGLR